MKCGSASTWMDHDLDGQRDSIPDQPRGQLTSRARLGVVLVNQTSSCSIQLEDMSEKVLGTVPQLWLNNALPNVGESWCTVTSWERDILRGSPAKIHGFRTITVYGFFKMTESFKMQIFKRSSQQIS